LGDFPNTSNLDSGPCPPILEARFEVNAALRLDIGLLAPARRSKARDSDGLLHSATLELKVLGPITSENVLLCPFANLGASLGALAKIASTMTCRGRQRFFLTMRIGERARQLIARRSVAKQENVEC
jgi:hypothetical protein